MESNGKRLNSVRKEKKLDSQSEWSQNAKTKKNEKHKGIYWK